MSAKKTVLITGATSGIGEALVSQYVDKNYNVIACGRSSQKLSQVEEGVFQTLRFDVNDESQIEAAATQVSNIDILILNAGDCKYIDNVKHFDSALFKSIINTNLTSLGDMLAQFLPKLSEGGQLVFVSSSATIVPFPRAEAYGASKAGMDYLANSIRLDLAKDNIDVTLVHPGFIETPLTDKNDFGMPFIMSSEAAAKRIFNGVNERKNYLQFPKRLTVMLHTFSIFPAALWQFLITRTSAK